MRRLYLLAAMTIPFVGSMVLNAGLVTENTSAVVWGGVDCNNSEDEWSACETHSMATGNCSDVYHEATTLVGNALDWLEKEEIDDICLGNNCASDTAPLVTSVCDTVAGGGGY